MNREINLLKDYSYSYHQEAANNNHNNRSKILSTDYEVYSHENFGAPNTIS
jgi:hypothetical protein